MKIKDIFWAFPCRLRRQGRALARLSACLTACTLLATIPNALLSCSKKPLVTTPTSAPSNAGDSPSASVQSTTKTPLPAKPDLDLTKMSATMIYSTIFDMLIMPEDYVEKVIKVKGWFQTYQNPEDGQTYFAVVVPDATACCQQGLEFIWPGDHHYPADYPNNGDDITITGLYKLTDKDGFTYNYLEAIEVEF